MIIKNKHGRFIENKVKRVCEFCKKDYITIPSCNLKFCSNTCYWASAHVIFTCEACNKQIPMLKSRAKNKRFCSNKCAKLGKENPNWKGNKVGYIGLHVWIKSRKPKPEFCECCGKVPPYDLANISGEYKRDINDFEWLCRSCHMNKDKRMNNLLVGLSENVTKNKETGRFESVEEV